MKKNITSPSSKPNLESSPKGCYFGRGDAAQLLGEPLSTARCSPLLGEHAAGDAIQPRQLLVGRNLIDSAPRNEECVGGAITSRLGIGAAFEVQQHLIAMRLEEPQESGPRFGIASHQSPFAERQSIYGHLTVFLTEVGYV